MCGFHDKLKGDYTQSNPVYRVSRVHGKHKLYDTMSLGRKDNEDTCGRTELKSEWDESILAQALAKHARKINATAQVIPLAPLFYYHLQKDQLQALRGSSQVYNTHLNLFPDSRKQLKLWDAQIARWNGKITLNRHTDVARDSDAFSCT